MNKILIRPEDGDGDAEKHLLGVEEHFSQAAEVFRAAAKRVETGEFVTPVTARDLAHEYRKTATLLFEERRRLAGKRKHKHGIVQDFALDFGEARDEIRRRMACLRSAGEGRDLSE